jgi:hypothetical protein
MKCWSLQIINFPFSAIHFTPQCASFSSSTRDSFQQGKSQINMHRMSHRVQIHMKVKNAFKVPDVILTHSHTHTLYNDEEKIKMYSQYCQFLKKYLEVK